MITVQPKIITLRHFFASNSIRDALRNYDGSSAASSAPPLLVIKLHGSTNAGGLHCGPNMGQKKPPA
eukprot:5992910-Amphidinium_carterae.1